VIAFEKLLTGVVQIFRHPLHGNWFSNWMNMYNAETDVEKISQRNSTTYFTLFNLAFFTQLNLLYA